MSQPLTTAQSAYFGALDIAFDNFKTALVAAIEADNDPESTTLSEAIPLRENVNQKHEALAQFIGYAGVAPGGALKNNSNDLQRGGPPYGIIVLRSATQGVPRQ